MASNIDVTPGTGKTVATDEVGGFQYQMIKMGFGAAGSYTLAVAGTGVDGNGVQRVSLATNVPLPTGSNVIGAVTQSGSWTVTASGTVAATQSGTWTVQPGNTANTTAWLVTGTGGTFPATQSGTWNITNISGTVSLPTGAATEASLAKLTVSQGASLGSNTQALVGGSVTTAAPTYTTGQISPLSLTTGGAIRVDASGTTVTVSGTVNAAQSGTWNITNVSGTVSLPTGASTEASLAKLTIAQGASLGSNTQALMGGSVTTAAPTYTTGQISPLSLTTGGLLRVDAGTVTVSGTIAATQSGTWNITNVSGTVSLPTGASTLAEQQTQTASLSVIDDWDESDRAKVNLIVGQAGIAAGTGTDGATVPRVTLATNVALPAGTNVIGHVIADSGSTTVVTGNVTVVQATGTNLHCVLDTTSTTAVTQATGTNLHMVVDSGTVTTVSTVTSLSQWAGNAIDTNSGNKSAGTLRVVLATDQPALTTPLPVQQNAATTGGTSLPYSFLSTAAVQAAAIKASAGQVYALHFFNISATAVYVRLYDMTTTPGTGDTVVYRAMVPGNTAAAGFVVAIPPGVVFATGIGIRVTAAIADNDNTSLSANTVMGNVFYK